MTNILYGDGVHDDTAAIQELIDASCEVRLPCPKKHFLISKPLELHSNCKLCLPRYAEIRLAPASNCVMLKNKTKGDYGERTASKLFSFLNHYSPDFPCENIEVEGGIWNFNNKQQNPNPILSGKYEPEGYSGFGFLFYNVKGFRMSSMTLKDPCNFSVTLDTVSYFNVENITFDFNDGNEYQSNMDGIHINGNCHHGHIEKLFGTCYDDTVALNAQEGSCGPISDITIRGIYTEGAYSAVRLLSSCRKSPIRNVHISDVHGTFYHFCVSFQHHYDTGERGLVENVEISNIYAAKSDRNLVKFYLVHTYDKYGIIDFAGQNDYKNITVENLHRKESIDATPTVRILENANIDHLILHNITTENYTGSEQMPVLVNSGNVKNLEVCALYENGKVVHVLV